ncbi:MAG TPA: deoxyribonuclease IV [Gemmatimonadaceae bacterium]|nr:deoxyribonuclease IV [Gemmatimonadaceae bacterium]
MTRILGAHTIDNGGIHMALRRAAAAKMTAVQLFTAPPKFYGDKSSVRAERVARFGKALEESGIQPENVMAHAAYVLNLATADDGKWARSSAGLAKELERSTALGIGLVCFHPGAAGDGDRKSATRRVAKALTAALKAVPGKTRLLVENSAGAGSTVGRTAEEVGEILRNIPDSLRERTGYGLDTCHLFVSGHDIARARSALDEVLEDFERETGESPSFFHFNDSEGALGSNKDRHVLIGDGTIGVDPFRWLMQDRRTRDIPLILETPQQHYEIAEDDASPDPYDLKMMELLRSLER